MGRDSAGPTVEPRGQMEVALSGSRFDTSVPHPARRYDYWLGGKDNFAADRESADAIAAAYPSVRIAALENRWYLHRVVRFLAEEAGIRQFLDIGTGIPDQPQCARDRAVGRPEHADRLRGQRPDRPGPRAGAADQRPGGRHRIH